VQSLLIQARYRAALERCDAVLRSHTEILPEDKQNLQRTRALAEAHLGQADKALVDFLKVAPSPDSGGAPAQPASLQATEIRWLAGQQEAARHAAADLLQRFRNQGQLDSALRAALLAAVTSRSLRDDAGRDQFAKQAVDIMASLQHNWSPHALQAYLSRPDIRLLMRAAALPQPAPSN
jgi:hypothetical protein